MSIKAQKFLEQKLREKIAECHVPALAAAMARNGGSTLISAQLGVRKLGATGATNTVQPSDKFNLGSVSKVFTGNLIGKLIQDGIGGLQWTTPLGDVHADLWALPAARDIYKAITIEQLLTHTSGLPYAPATDDAYDFRNYTALDMTPSKLKARRRQYTLAAVLDAPQYWPPGSGAQYSGGGIIAASMAEKKTGQTYEELMQQHVFGPLGMGNAGFGVLSTAALNGPWQHRFDAATGTATPDDETRLPGYSWHCRIPVGGVCSSAGDMAFFMREQVRDTPQLFTPAMRQTMQTQGVSPHSSAVRGAWGSSQPGSASAVISHNGDNGVSYANLVVHLAKKLGMASMSNMNSQLSSAGVNDMIEVMTLMDANWDALFGSGSAEPIECAHATPALAATSTNNSTLMLFARRHDGRVLRRRSLNGGASWDDAGDFGGVQLNSGVSAAASAGGQVIYVIGRGLDNRAWFGTSTDGGSTWKGWVPIGNGVFTTGLAIACSANGQVVHVVGIGNDQRMWRTRSLDGGSTWAGWVQVGAGVFTSAPAIATSANGAIVHLAGRGTDWRAWRNTSSDSGNTFQAHWVPVGKQVCTASPALAVSDNGQRVHLAVRGSDRRLWRNTSTNAGSTWLTDWQAVESGTFTSAPTLATDSAGMVLDAYAFGGDFRIWGNRSADGGLAWGGWSQKGSQFFV
jgi:CubicO group peptidase (beta-lactamase class C family)